MPLATNKMRILGNTKNPVTGEFYEVKAPVGPPKPKLTLVKKP